VTDAPPPVRDGRSLRWRVGMLLAAAVSGGVAYALVAWPRLLVFAAAAPFAALAVFFVVSAVCARSR
jgi:hypothetical protein